MDASINPALAEARFCPRCGQLADITFPRSIACPHCGYAAYFNPKPVAGAIPVDDKDGVILLRRGFDPAQGRWTFPGGFVDLGESVEDAAHRERPTRSWGSQSSWDRWWGCTHARRTGWC
jgi:NADH pyrophosphatase NudC (nudix superfamily)